MIQHYLKKLGVLALVFSGTIFITSRAQAQSLNCTNLFFSEYVEGSSNNKAIEIYNPTGAAINLSGYTVELHANGSSTTPQTLALSGTIASGGVYVISNASASLTGITGVSNITSSVTNFNGDDALLLRFGTDTLDIIGNVGCDPGTSWNSGTHDMLNKTLVRKNTVQKGIKNNPGVAATCAFPTLVTEWDVYPIDDVSHLGSHTSTCIAPPAGPTVSFKNGSATVAENVTGGTYTLMVRIANPSATAAASVDVALGTTGTATAGTDFTFTGSTLNWAAGDTTSRNISITITDDAILESNETVVLTLSNPSTGVALGTSTFTLTIQDNEVAPIPTYTVAQISANDPVNFLPDSAGVKVRVYGTLYGDNQRTTGLQLTLIDNTGGIGLFTNSAAVVPPTAPIESDSVYVVGTVGHFNGLTQITLDSIVVLANNRPLVQPTVVTTLGENTESKLITIANPVSLVDPNQWNNTGTSSFNVDVTDGTNTYQMRIINNSNIFPTAAPTGIFVLTGIGGQFDSSDPRDSGYQIIPRRLSDIRNVTGISENLNNQISIYPNPVANVLKMNLRAINTKNAVISVVNSLGQVVANVPANASELDVTNFPAGIYSLRIATLQGVAVKRFVKIN